MQPQATSVLISVITSVLTTSRAAFLLRHATSPAHPSHLVLHTVVILIIIVITVSMIVIIVIIVIRAPRLRHSTQICRNKHAS